MVHHVYGHIIETQLLSRMLSTCGTPSIQCVHCIRVHCLSKGCMSSSMLNLWLNKKKFTQAGTEPLTSGLTCLRSANWANKTYGGGLPTIQPKWSQLYSVNFPCAVLLDTCWCNVHSSLVIHKPDTGPKSLVWHHICIIPPWVHEGVCVECQGLLVDWWP